MAEEKIVSEEITSEQNSVETASPEDKEKYLKDEENNNYTRRTLVDDLNFTTSRKTRSDLDSDEILTTGFKESTRVQVNSSSRKNRYKSLVHYGLVEQTKNLKPSSLKPTDGIPIISPETYISISNIPSWYEMMLKCSFLVRDVEDLIFLSEIGYDVLLPMEIEIGRLITSLQLEQYKPDLTRLTRLVESREDSSDSIKELVYSRESVSTTDFFYLSLLKKHQYVRSGAYDNLEGINKLLRTLPTRIPGRSLLSNYIGTSGTSIDDRRWLKLGKHILRVPKLALASAILNGFNPLTYPFPDYVRYPDQYDPVVKIFFDKVKRFISCLSYAENLPPIQKIKVGRFVHDVGWELQDFLIPDKMNRIESQQHLDIVSRLTESHKYHRSPFSKAVVANNSPLYHKNLVWDCGGVRVFIEPCMIKGSIIAKVYYAAKAGSDQLPKHLGDICAGKPFTTKNRDGTTTTKYSKDGRLFFSSPNFLSDYVSSGNYTATQERFRKEFIKANSDEEKESLRKKYYGKLPPIALPVVTTILPQLGLWFNSYVKSIPRTSFLADPKWWFEHFRVTVDSLGSDDGLVPTNTPAKLVTDHRGVSQPKDKNKKKKSKDTQPKADKQKQPKKTNSKPSGKKISDISVWRPKDDCQ